MPNPLQPDNAPPPQVLHIRAERALDYLRGLCQVTTSDEPSDALEEGSNDQTMTAIERLKEATERLKARGNRGAQ